MFEQLRKFFHKGGKNHKWKKVSFKNNSDVNVKISHATIKEKTEEFLKRGGKIIKLQPIDAIIDLDDIKHLRDRVHGSDEKLRFLKETNQGY